MPGQPEGPRPVTDCLPLYLHGQSNGIVCSPARGITAELCAVETSLSALSSPLGWEQQHRGSDRRAGSAPSLGDGTGLTMAWDESLGMERQSSDEMVAQDSGLAAIVLEPLPPTALTLQCHVMEGHWSGHTGVDTALCSCPGGPVSQARAEVHPHVQCHYGVGTDAAAQSHIPSHGSNLHGPTPPGPFSARAWAAPTHLFVHRALLHLGAVTFGGGGLLPEARPAAGPVGRRGHHAAAGGSLVLHGVEQRGRRAAAADGWRRRGRLVDAALRARAVLPGHGGLAALLGQRQLPPRQLARPAREVLGGGAGEAQLVGRQLLAVAVGAERAVALGAGVAQAAGGQRQPGGHLVHGVLEGQRRQQLRPARRALAARRGGGLAHPAHGGHARHAVLLSPCAPHALQLPQRRLTVIERVGRAGHVGPTVQEPIVLQVHHGQTLAAIRHLHVGLIGL